MTDMNSFQPEPSIYASDEEALVVGIDLGTSRSAVTATNGVRRMVESYVGWPRDPIALRHIKKSIVFGAEALENRLSVRLFRPLERGVLKHTLDGESDGDQAMGNKEAARELIRHLIHIAEPMRDQKVYGVVGVPAQASLKSKQALIEAAKDTMDAVMLVSQPFAVAYGLEVLDGSIVVDIGAGTIDICRMHGTMPEEVDQRSLATAGDDVDRNFEELLHEKYPDAQFTLTMLKKVKEAHAFVSGEVERVKAVFPANGSPTEYDVTDELKIACETILYEINDALHELIATFDPEFQQKLRSNVILSGGGSQMVGLPSRIRQDLEDIGGANVRAVEEPLYAGANGALQLAIDMPEEYWHRLT
ncbi:MAG: rod shape-determining protein [Planctomycetes bacterium]|nr:rod shape-determining protein [Planctomycetota bacterium]